LAEDRAAVEFAIGSKRRAVELMLETFNLER
jgi:hypothetical protein